MDQNWLIYNLYLDNRVAVFAKKIFSTFGCRLSRIVEGRVHTSILNTLLSRGFFYFWILVTKEELKAGLATTKVASLIL